MNSTLYHILNAENHKKATTLFEYIYLNKNFDYKKYNQFHGTENYAAFTNFTRKNVLDNFSN